MIDFYCIHKQGDADSLPPLSDAIDSGKKFNINVIPYAGIYSNIDSLIAQEKLIITSK